MITQQPGGFRLMLVLVLQILCAFNAIAQPGSASLQPSSLLFIENKGQLTNQAQNPTSEVAFYAISEGTRIYFSQNKVTYVFREKIPAISEATGKAAKSKKPEFLIREKQVSMFLVNGNQHAKITASESSTERYNFYYSHCPQGIINVQSYKKLVYENVYPNIDMVFHTGIKGMKYDFIVHPGGNPDDIQMYYEGATEAIVSNEGKLIVNHILGNINEAKPYTYQTLNSLEKEVPSGFVLKGKKTVGFNIGKYNNKQDLIIDPFATYYGGNVYEEARDLEIDDAGNIYITGLTASDDFPTQTVTGGYNQTIISGGDDAFIIKFNSSGVRQWATFFGGSDYEDVTGIGVNGAGDLAITGFTFSTDLPVQTTGGYSQSELLGFQDAFVVKLNSSGARTWSTYIGGSDDDEPADVAVDEAGNVILTGYTLSADYPVQSLPNAYNQATQAMVDGMDAFVTRFSPDGHLNWSTYYGSYGVEKPGGICTDANGNIYITGMANAGLPLQTLTGAYNQTFTSSATNYADLFLAKFANNGALTWATYYGGNAEELTARIAADGASNISMTGSTRSTDFPVQSLTGAYNQTTYGGGETDAFIVKFSATGARIWATYYGGTGMDQGLAIGSDADNNVLLGGSSMGGGLPTLSVDGGFNQLNGSTLGDMDGFIAKFNTSGVRQWATYYGGSEGNEEIKGIAGDGANNVVATGYGESTSLPVQGNTGGYTQTNNYGQKVILVQFSHSGALASGSEPQTITFEPLPNREYGDFFTISATSSSGLPVTFSVSGPAYISGNEISITGIGTVTITASQNGNATYAAADPVQQSFCVNSPAAYSVDGDTVTCLGNRTYATVHIDGAIYNWIAPAGDSIVSQTESSAVVKWNSTGIKTLSVSLSSNCAASGIPSSTNVRVIETPEIGTVSSLSPADGSNNLYLPLTFSWNKVENAENYDLYVWPDTLNYPFTRGTNIIDTFMTLSTGLDYGVLYKWKIAAKSYCGVKESLVQSFTLNCITPGQPSEISGPASTCAEDAIYTVNSENGVNYKWEVNSGDKINGFEGIAIVSWTTPGTYTLKVTPYVTCNTDSGPSRTIEVTVVDLPVPGAVTNMIPADSSSGLSYPLNLSWTAAPNAENYDIFIWRKGTTKPTYTDFFDVDSTAIVINSGLDYGVEYYWQVVSKNSCHQYESPIQTFTLNCITPNQPSEIAGLTEVCPEEETYSIIPESGIIYTWTTNGGATISGTGASVSVTWNTPGIYTLTVTPSVSCGLSGTARTVEVTVLDTPVPGMVSNMIPANGTDTLNLPFDFSWTAGENAQFYDLYLWPATENKPAYATEEDLTATTFRIFNNMDPAVTYNWQVVSRNACKSNEGPVQTVKLLCPVPDQVEKVNGLTEVCPGEWEYRIQTSYGIDYEWAVTGGNTIADSGSFILVNWLTTGTFDLTVTPVATCGERGASTTVSVTVSDPVTPAAITSMNPLDGAMNTPVPAIFSWEASAGASLYDLYVWPDSLASRPQLPTIRDIAGTAFSLKSLKNETEYKWQVIAKNNCRQTEGAIQTFKTAALPDLQIVSYQIPENTTTSASLSLTWEVKNNGNNSTGNSQWSDKVYLSPDRDLRRTDDILLGTFSNVSYLLPSRSYVQIQDVKMPSEPGTYYLFIITDNTQANCTDTLIGDVCSGIRDRGIDNVSESNEENNYIYQTIYIAPAPAADLTVNSVGAPTDVFNGSTFNVTYEVQNIGQANAVGLKTYASGTIYSATGVSSGGSISGGGGSASCYDNYWNDVIYLSKDQTFSKEEDIYIGYSFIALKSTTQKDLCMNFAGIPLAVDSAYTRTTQVSLLPKYVGDYYILVVSAADEGVDEANRFGNNVRASEMINISLAPPPDFAVSAAIPPAIAEGGEEAPFSFTITNEGAAAPHKSEVLWFDEIFLSKKNTFVKDSAISILKAYQSFGPLFSADSSYIVSKNIRIPAGLEGNYYMYVYSDREDKVFEYTFNENNLRRSDTTFYIGPGKYAELEVLSVTVPDTIYAGKDFTISWELKNNGPGNTAIEHYDGIYFSQDSAYNPTSILGKQKMALLPESGATQIRQKQLKAPYVIGDAWFFISADMSDKVFENGIENNNIKGTAKKVYIQYAPLEADLDLLTFTAPAMAQSGTSVSMEWVVMNNGNDITSASTWADAIYLSEDTILDMSDKSILLKNFRYSQLPSAGVYTAKTEIAIPHGLSGNYHLFVFADANGTIENELVRENNKLRVPIALSMEPTADLVVTSLKAPAEAYAGQTIKVHYSVQNQGGTATTTKYNLEYYTDGIWLGIDPALSPNGNNIHLTSIAHSAIQADETITDSIEVIIPEHTVGFYYLFLKADHQNYVFEHEGEENNLSVAIPIRITSAAPADLIVSKLSVAANAYLGDTIQTAYTIKNIGTQPAIGILRNNVSLSRNIVLEPNQDFLIDFETESVDIAPGDSVIRNLSSTLSGVLPETYNGIVQTNSTIGVNETNTENNTKISSNPITIGAKKLFLDIVEKTQLRPGVKLYYEIQVEADLDLLLTLTSNQTYGLNEVYVAYNRIPSSADYDYKYADVNRPNQKVLIPGTKAGTYYVMATTSVGYSGNQNIDLLAKALPFSILSVTPNQLGQGSVSTVLNGAGFREGIQVVLKSAGVTAATAQVKFVNSMQLGLRWDLTSTPIGLYDLVAINPNNNEQILVQGVSVEKASPYTVDYIPQIPGLLRKGKNGFYTFTFKNISNIDIPVLHGDFTVLGQAEVVEVKKVEGRMVTGSDFPIHPEIPGSDVTVAGDLKLIPFLSKNLAPGEQITIAINFGLKGFSYNTFPLYLRLRAYHLDYYLDKMNEDMEIVRRAILADPEQVNASLVPGLAELAVNRKAFVDTMMVPLFKTGLLLPEDTLGFDFACDSCLNLELLEALYADSSDAVVFTFDPGESPGTAQYATSTFGPAEDYLWEINHYNGAAGGDPGWDLVRVKGKLEITATSANPFTVRISSIDEDNYPGYLSGWYPAVNKTWPIAIAEEGIEGFDVTKFAIDTSRFAAYNYTYGGKFSVKMQGTDTLLLQFTARIPKTGEPGIPGAPGGWGQPGSPGGTGGSGDATTAPGQGGQGGAGGPGGGKGGPGGAGGNTPIGIGGPGGPGGPGGTGTGDDSGSETPGSEDPGTENPGAEEPGDGGEGGPGGTGPEGTGPTGPKGPGGIIDPGPGTTPPGVPPGTPPRRRPGTRPKGPGSDRSSSFSYPAPPPRRPQAPEDEDKPKPPTLPCNETMTSNDACEKTFDIGANAAKAFIAQGDYKKYARLSEGIAAGSNFIENCYVKNIVGGVADALNGASGALDSKTLNPVISLNIAANAIKFTIGITLCSEKDEGVKRRGKMIMDLISCVNSSSIAELSINLGACIGKNVFCTNILSSCDPNEIIGPVGYGPDKMVSATNPMGYRVNYENDSVFATTSAQRVRITVPVDRNLNPLSFRMGSFGFGKYRFDVPPNSASYFNVLNLPDSLGYDVQVTAGVDVMKNELFWIFQTVDPVTGLAPANPLSGYLPINDALGSGEGYVTYTIKPKSDVVTGDTVHARANIVFDTNDPIITNQAQNLLDAVAPVSSVDSLPAIIDSVATIEVSILDDVKGSGVNAYDLYVSENGESFTVLNRDQLAGNIYNFTGTPGHNYCFFSIAKDNTGNTEAMKNKGDVCVHVKGDSTAIALLQPNGAERYCPGDEITVAWASESVNTVNLLYSSNAGQSFEPIATGLSGTGTYNWILPQHFISGNYLVKVVDITNETNADTSDATFSIGNAGLVIAGPDETVCRTAATITLAGYSPAGGIWTGTGVNAIGVFEPALAEVGVNTLSYSLNLNGCSTTVTKDITVTEGPEVTLAPFEPVSITTPAFALTGGTPEGGTWSGMGMSNGIFNPSVTNAGSFNITYTYQEASGCAGSATQIMVVNGAIETPTGLATYVASSSQINVHWQDNSTSETGYLIERSTKPDVGFAVIDTLTANTTAYSDTSLNAGVTYYYRVVAVNSTGGRSGYSNVSGATTTPTATVAGLEESMLVNLYPNVVQNNFTLEYKPVETSGHITVTIYNLQGVVLMRKELRATGSKYVEQFNVSGIGSGTYFLKVWDNGKNHVKSFMKQ